MRLDKFLKNARIIKRRTLAKEACETGAVSIGDKIAKAGDEVHVGDTIEVRFGTRTVCGEVTELIENPRKDDAQKMFRIL